MAGRDDQRSGSGPGRQAVVTVDDQRNAKSVARRSGDELGADRRTAHGQHDDGVDVSQPGVRRKWLGHTRRLRELPRDLGDLPEHVVGVEPTQASPGRRA